MLHRLYQKNKNQNYFTLTIIESAICKAVVRLLRSVNNLPVLPE